MKKLNQILYGADYNPDQWLDRPDILEKDVEYMKEAGINCVTINIFGWSTLEPSEGRYETEWLKDAVDRLYEAGIMTILATPSGAIPNWLSAKYPEVLQVRENGVRNLPGSRHNFCYTSPVMREKVRQIDSRLAQTFTGHPGVIMWHISNELGGNGADASCHCEACQSAFRQWLKEKYHTLDALNHAWWSSFWSHTYTDWEQIRSPQVNGELLFHGLNLDWKRFVTHQMLEFYEMEYETVKALCPEIPVTTNFMEYFKPLDYFKFRDSLDIVSWDAYPDWHAGRDAGCSPSDDIAVAVSTAVNHNIMRSIRKQPFLLLESTPSLVNWKSCNRAKKPGMNMLSSLQAVAHGSDSVLYFQWRKGRGAVEKMHGAVIDHDGGIETRVFREVKELGERLKRLSDCVCGTVNHAKAAIIFDWENWWALDDAAGPRKDMEYIRTVEAHYRPFWEMGIDVDIIDMEQGLEGYQLVIAPMTYLLKHAFSERIRAFVESGGFFVNTYWSGIVNETDLCYLGGMPGLIHDMMGMKWEEIDALPSGETIALEYRGETYQASRLIATAKISGAKVLGTYTEDFYSGNPAVTQCQYGEGQTFCICSENEPAFLSKFYQDIVELCGIQRNMNIMLPYGVTVTKREGDGRSVYFIQNFNDAVVELVLDQAYRILETDEIVEGKRLLDRYECLVLELS